MVSSTGTTSGRVLQFLPKSAVNSVDALNDWSVLQIESVWVSHPAESWFDKIRQHSSLVEYVNGPDSSWMRAETHDFISRLIRMACFCNWLEHFWYYAPSEIFENTMFIHKDTHGLGILLTKSFSSEEDLIRQLDWTNMRMLVICGKCYHYQLSILPILLYPESYFHFLGLFKYPLLQTLPAYWPTCTQTSMPSSECVLMSLPFPSVKQAAMHSYPWSPPQGSY